LRRKEREITAGQTMIPTKRNFILFATALLALNGIVFWPVVNFEFVRWDDDINITHNPLLTAPWSWDLVKQIFSADQALRFKPLHWLLTRAVHRVGGMDPAVWHGLNLVLHLATALLFYGVLRQVLKLRGWLAAEAEVPAFLAAAFWSVHPLRSEVVGWATASPYPLAAGLLLGSFGFYLKAHQNGVVGRPWLVASWLLAGLSYASYPVGVSYVLWLMVVDRWLLGVADGRQARWWLKHATFLLPAMVALGFTVWSRYESPGIFTEAPDLDSVGWPVRLLFALASIADLVWRGFWPMSLTPNLPPVAFAGETLVRVVALALFAGLGLLFAWRRRRAPGFLSAVIFGFAALSLPCLGVTERPTWPVDRYSYVTHLVLIGAGAAAIAGLIGRPRKTAWVMMAVVVLAGAVAARRQLMIWQDSGTLFTSMEQHPHFNDSPRQRGHIYILWARHEAEKGNAERSHDRLNQAYGTYVAGIRTVLQRNDYQEALKLLTHIERYFAIPPDMRREKGSWLLQVSRREEALRELRIAEKDLPGDPRVRALLVEAGAAAKSDPN
jgi:protein O-mannosyl-transferase